MRSRLLALAAVLLLAAPASAAGATRYAFPGGGSTPGCPALEPCSLAYAVTGAEAGDEVVVGPGTYAEPTRIETEAPLSIHGAAGLTRPRVVAPPGEAAFRSFAPQVIRDLAFEATGSGEGALFVPAEGTVLERLELIAHGDGALALRPGTSFLLSDSLLLAVGKGAVGLFVQGVATGTSQLRNDAVIASGEETVGVATSVLLSSADVRITRST